MASEDFLTPVHRLPPEILSSILLQTAPPIRRAIIRHFIRFASICSYWRNTIIYDPRFWTTIACHYNVHDWKTDCLETFFTRSKSMKFSLLLYAGQQCFHGAVYNVENLINRHSERIESLEFVNHTLNILEQVDGAFPALRSLLGVTHGIGTKCDIPYPILSQAVNLEVLQIHIPHDFTPWIRELLCLQGSVRKLDITVETTASLPHLFNALSHFRVLDALCIRRAYPSFEDDFAPFSWPPITLPTLTSLYVLTPLPAFSIQIPNLRHMGLSFRHWDPAYIEFTANNFDFSKIKFLSIACCKPHTGCEQCISGGEEAFPSCAPYREHKISIFSDLSRVQKPRPDHQFHTAYYSDSFFGQLLHDCISMANSVTDVKMNYKYLNVPLFDGFEGMFGSPTVRHLTVHSGFDPQGPFFILGNNASIYPKLESITYFHSEEESAEGIPADDLEQHVVNFIYVRKEFMKKITLHRCPSILQNVSYNEISVLPEFEFIQVDAIYPSRNKESSPFPELKYP